MSSARGLEDRREDTDVSNDDAASQAASTHGILQIGSERCAEEDEVPTMSSQPHPCQHQGEWKICDWPTRDAFTSQLPNITNNMSTTPL